MEAAGAKTVVNVFVTAPESTVSVQTARRSVRELVAGREMWVSPEVERNGWGCAAEGVTRGSDGRERMEWEGGGGRRLDQGPYAKAVHLGNGGGKGTVM